MTNETILLFIKKALENNVKIHKNHDFYNFYGDPYNKPYKFKYKGLNVKVFKNVVIIKAPFSFVNSAYLINNDLYELIKNSYNEQIKKEFKAIEKKDQSRKFRIEKKIKKILKI